MTSHKSVAIETALSAGSFIVSRMGKVRELGYKGEINLVTDVDRNAEKMIVKSLKKTFPDYGILTEEAGEEAGQSDYKWLIDPLDGTTNFAHSFPFFAVSIALEKAGQVILGVVYDPMKKELFVAERHHGAYLNRKRIFVSKTKRLYTGLLATGFAYRFKEKKASIFRDFVKFLMRAQGVRRAGSAALDLCYVACGRFDGYWERDLFPWDTAAGKIIVEEAKGRVTRFNGLAYTPYHKEILASNGYIHRQMINVLRTKNKI
jgi:myo-inositol-1(or 4)-monophosphatase